MFSICYADVGLLLCYSSCQERPKSHNMDSPSARGAVASGPRRFFMANLESYKTKGKKAANERAATAIHAKHSDGNRHIVGIGNLRVIIVPDGKLWFAQGLEIDYAVQGNSVEDAKRQLEAG